MEKNDDQVNLKIFRFKKNSLGILIMLAIALTFFAPMLFGNKAIFYRDFTFVTFPFRFFLAQIFHEGAIPYWNSNVYGGMPFMAGFHAGVFYPPSIVFFLQDTVLALNLFYLLHFLILGIFSFLLARSWGISFAAALCCGITGMLSGFIVASTLLSNFFMAAVWLPLVFWLFHQFWVRHHIGYFIGLVVAIAAQTLAASPELSIMTLVLLYAHSLYFLPRAPGVTGVVRMTAPLGLAVILALGLSALQLIPTAKLMEHSLRDQGITYENHVQSSLEASKLSTLVLSPDYEGLLDTRDYPSWFPGFLHTIYMGVLALVFVLLGFIFRREKPIGFWLVVFVLGLFLSFGKFNPMYETVYPWVPLLDLFRFPEKYFFISSFAAVFLSGYVLDALIQKIEKRQLKIIPILTVLVVLLGVILILARWHSYLDPKLPLTVLLIFGCSLAMFYYKKFNRTVFTAVVCLLVLIDLSAKDLQLMPTIDRKFYEEKPLVMDIVGDSFGKYRIYSGRIAKTPNPDMNPPGPTWMDELILAKQYLRPFTGMVLGVEHAGGHPGLGLELRKHLVWFYALIDAPPDKRFRILKRSNVKYWIDGDSLTQFNAEGTPLIVPGRVKIWEDALPRAYLVGRIKLKEESKILDTYYDESFDPLSEVLLSQPVNFEASPHFDGTVEEVTYRPNHVTVKTVQQGKGFLVLMDSYFPGWTVKVDGEEKPIVRANHFYRAVQLDSGAHTLEFDYFPEGFKVGLIVSSVVCILLMVLPLWRWRRADTSQDT
jgi:Bacterial membrane protein YfhO